MSNRKNNKNNKDHLMFNDTIKQIRKLTSQFTNQQQKKTMGLTKNNSKMPLTHLVGRRKKLKERYHQEKRRAKEQNIQYDSSSKLLNSDFMKQLKEKDGFVKNRYKFQSQNIGTGVGNYKGGVLNLSEKDLRRIQGPGEGGKGGASHRFKPIQKGGGGGRKGGRQGGRPKNH